MSDPAGPSGELRAFLADDWRQWLDEYPELGTVYGYPGYNDRWTDDSAEGITRRKEHLAATLARLQRFDPSQFGAADRTNFDLYLDLLTTATRGLAFGDDPMPFHFGMPHNLWMPINQMEGVHSSAADIIAMQPAATAADLGDLVRRLERLPAAIDQNLALLREGVAAGYTPPRIAIRNVPDQVRGLLHTEPLASPYLAPFTKIPEGVAPAESDRLRAAASEAYAHAVAPALQRLLDYLVGEYLPVCRETIGASDLPNGPASYAYHLRWQTTTAQSAQEIHDIGLREVARLRAEMEAIRVETGFAGPLAEFFRFLRTDPQFFYATPQQLLDGYRIIAKTIDPSLARVFGKLPRLPYGIEPIPEFRAPGTTTAYYQGGAASSGRPGIFFANTYDLSARPRWEMEALALHEAVPGHHLQIALTEELADLPEFRRYSGYTAFVEGWGLYAESLGKELGLYREPYARMGQLIYDMWRSIRLVVDTGMHAFGWSRDQAIAFFRENAGKADLDIINEVDRYIVWPGQALAYKIGQLKFRELRTAAEQQLGNRFDVRAFHDVLLAEGGLPLGAVESQVAEWIAAQRRRPAAAGP